MQESRGNSRIHLKRAAVLCAATLLVSSVLTAPAFAGNLRFSGALNGQVTDPNGKPRADAVVLLFNRQNRLLQKAATDALGSFAFADLLPDVYSVQVSLENFMPAVRENILVKPGMRSILSVNLSKVFSSVQVLASAPLPGGLMNDNWKWILRSDDALRPVLRFLPGPRVDSPDEAHSSIFTDSRGVIRLSAGDNLDAGTGGDADLGTQFAFATSLYGGNHIQLAGGLGYASASGAPSAAIRTTYSHDLAGAHPAVSVTMREFSMPMRLGQMLVGNPNDTTLPTLRTMDVAFSDRTNISDTLSMDYGMEMDTVSYGNHLAYISPFAKLTRELPHGKVDFIWTSGNGRPELGMSSADPNADLQRDLNSLATVPLVTVMDGQAKVQRGSDYEMGVSQRFGSREYRVAAYYDDVMNTALTIASPPSGLFSGELVPDMMSNSALFNAGHFQTSGINASVAQDLGQNYQVSVIYSELGVLSPTAAEIPGTSADDLRNLLQTAHRPAVTFRTTGTVRATGTRFVASYEWTNYQSMLPGPTFSTQATRPEPGLNVMIRQPIPTLPWIPWRMEASAELRNLLAQGYLPLALPGAQQLLLVNTPRSVRGGLAFIF